MILFGDAAPPQQEMRSLYSRLPVEGMVHSSLMCGERYDLAPDFDEAWACSSVTWSVGGDETYTLENRKTYRVRSSGVMTFGREERYAYAASDGARFRSNMIVFPNHVADAGLPLRTRFEIPGRRTAALMQAIADACVQGWVDENWYAERIEVLYRMLVREQSRGDLRLDDLGNKKAATRSELRRRVRRACVYLLERYADASISLNDVAREACMSRFHLIRTFKVMSGMTPMRYLAVVRMDAAARLLRAGSVTVSDVGCRVGVPDRTTFYRQFRARHGVSPSQFVAEEARGWLGS